MLIGVFFLLLFSLFKSQVLQRIYEADTTIEKYSSWDVSLKYIAFLKDSNILIFDLKGNFIATFERDLVNHLALTYAGLY
jgi:hypothetical protein